VQRFIPKCKDSYPSANIDIRVQSILFRYKIISSLLRYARIILWALCFFNAEPIFQAKIIHWNYFFCWRGKIFTITWENFLNAINSTLCSLKMLQIFDVWFTPKKCSRKVIWCSNLSQWNTMLLMTSSYTKHWLINGSIVSSKQR
jgi:hypothetical protein